MSVIHHGDLNMKGRTYPFALKKPSTSRCSWWQIWKWRRWWLSTALTWLRARHLLPCRRSDACGSSSVTFVIVSHQALVSRHFQHSTRNTFVTTKKNNPEPSIHLNNKNVPIGMRASGPPTCCVVISAQETLSWVFPEWPWHPWAASSID